MLVQIWGLVMPLILASLVAFLLAKQLFVERATRRAILRAGEVLLTEKELEILQEDKLTQYVLELIEGIKGKVNLENLILAEMCNMLTLMGRKRSAERELAGYIVSGLCFALPMLLVPLVTEFMGYIVIYPIFVGVIIMQRYRELKKDYWKWQTELVRDLPDLIDKLRISFASGRDYIAAFMQVRDNSGMKMRGMIDKLISDLQCMRATQALDLFAQAFQMPLVNRFVSAVKIAIKYGYEAAENYFQTIESDITEIRCVVIEELTKSKPEKIYQLYLLIFALAVSALSVKAWELFSQLSTIL
ncbi:MAG TPA: hypothetical protein GX532_01165 [Clostridia bacterium]|jgi:hypothetical protein|nr:hypothetical protein [Clostridia bacterium]HHY05581.1 hypothetical protein [Clostridia bacterium]